MFYNINGPNRGWGGSPPAAPAADYVTSGRSENRDRAGPLPYVDDTRPLYSVIMYIAAVALEQDNKRNDIHNSWQGWERRGSAAAWEVWDPVGSQLPWTLPGLHMSLPLSGPAPLLGRSLVSYDNYTGKSLSPLQK